MNPMLRFLPLLLLVLLVGAVTWRLTSPADEKIASHMVGRPVPAFELPSAVPTKSGLSSAELVTGKPRLINIFASWCTPCIAEAPLLLELKRKGVTIDAIAVRDQPEDVAAFLAKHGDPYQAVGSDPESRVQIELGSSGVPETFVIDGRGIIRYQHIGPIQAGDIPMILRQWSVAQ